MIDRPGDSLIHCSELSGKVADRRLGQSKNRTVCQTALATVLPFAQTADDPSANGLQFAQTPHRWRRRNPGQRLEYFSIFTDMPRIHTIGLIAAKLGARKIPDLGGVYDADDMASFTES